MYKTTKTEIVNRITTVIPHQLIIILNVNRLNSPIKRHREAKWIFKKSNDIVSIRDSM